MINCLSRGSIPPFNALKSSNQGQNCALSVVGLFLSTKNPAQMSPPTSPQTENCDCKQATTGCLGPIPQSSFANLASGCFFALQTSHCGCILNIQGEPGAVQCPSHKDDKSSLKILTPQRGDVILSSSKEAERH